MYSLKALSYDIGKQMHWSHFWQLLQETSLKAGPVPYKIPERGRVWYDLGKSSCWWKRWWQLEGNFVYANDIMKSTLK